MTKVEIARKRLNAEIEGMKARFEKDVQAGINDAKAGIYDKWYRYHRIDDGAAYDAGWLDTYKNTESLWDKGVQIIEG